MPIIEVNIAEGRSPEVVRKLISELTAATHRALNVPVSNIRVLIREIPKQHWAAADTTLSERESGQ